MARPRSGLQRRGHETSDNAGPENLSQGYIINNKYLVGKNAEARYRLSDEWAKVAFTWMRNARQRNVSVTVETFASDYCLPAKHAESWVKAQVLVFGVVASGFRAFTRAVERLQSDSGRRNIVAWMSNADMKKQKHFGLEESAALVEEMQKAEGRH